MHSIYSIPTISIGTLRLTYFCSEIGGVRVARLYIFLLLSCLVFVVVSVCVFSDLFSSMDFPFLFILLFGTLVFSLFLLCQNTNWSSPGFIQQKKREKVGPYIPVKRSTLIHLNMSTVLVFMKKIMPNLLVNISISGPSIRPSIVPFLF